VDVENLNVPVKNAAGVQLVLDGHFMWAGHLAKSLRTLINVLLEDPNLLRERERKRECVKFELN
jgi:hypothetical protein